MGQQPGEDPQRGSSRRCAASCRGAAQAADGGEPGRIGHRVSGAPAAERADDLCRASRAPPTPAADSGEDGTRRFGAGADRWVIRACGHQSFVELRSRVHRVGVDVGSSRGRHGAPAKPQGPSDAARRGQPRRSSGRAARRASISSLVRSCSVYRSCPSTLVSLAAAGGTHCSNL